MAGVASEQLIAEFGLEARNRDEFLRSLSDIDRPGRPLPRSHAIRQAWHHLDLNGVLYANDQPVAYFKEVPAPPSDDELRDLHKRFWNHGVCPVLVLASAKKVEVFSARALPAKPHQDPRSQARLVEVFDRTGGAAGGLQDLTARIETGRILDDPKHFRPKDAVDQYLLRNLRATRRKLHDDGLRLATAHALLGRTIFACYLAQRRIITETLLRTVGFPGGDLVEMLAGNDAATARDLLYRLFGELQGPFKGSLFSDDLAAEQREVRPRHVEIVAAFLRGHDVATGQLALFSTYDFSVIPVELISSIYEEFIRAEGETVQRRTGAYYTPPQLAELVIDTAVEGDTTLLDKRFFDPACGSGIFLVAAFNRLAEEWRYRNPGVENSERAQALSEILKRNVVGVDVNPTACRIACFSLYLALLDQLDPRDIQKLAATGTLLPDLLGEGGATAGTIVCADFFEEDLPLGGGFDRIVGNPPWASRENVAADAPAVAWCARYALPMPQRQLATAFLWKCPRHAAAGGRISLLVPSIILLSGSKEFHERWLTAVTLDRVVQLADLRYLLFEHSVRPAAILSFMPGERTEGQIVHDTPTAEFSELNASVVTIWPEDRQTLSLETIIAAAARNESGVIWKTAMRATPRDRRFLERLESLPRLGDIAGTPKQRKRWVKGQGLQPLSEADLERGVPPKPAWWDSDHLAIRADDGGFRFDLVLTEDDCTPVSPDWVGLRRLPSQRRFAAPLVIFNQGFSHVAYSDFDVLFQHSLQSISGPQEDADLLALLTGYLQSSLARYIQFHTASYLGIERDKVSLFEVLRLPFPLPDELPDPQAARAAAATAAELLRKLKDSLSQPFGDHRGEIGAARRKLDKIIGEYFDVDEMEAVLIEDTLGTIAPSAMPRRDGEPPRLLRTPTTRERHTYTALLCEILSGWASRSKVKVSGRVVVSTAADIGIVTLTRDRAQEPYREESSREALDHVLKRIRPLLSERHGSFAYMRNMKVFDGPRLHLVKPLVMRHWLRTAAMNDADEIAAGICGGGGNGG